MPITNVEFSNLFKNYKLNQFGNIINVQTNKCLTCTGPDNDLIFAPAILNNNNTLIDKIINKKIGPPISKEKSKKILSQAFIIESVNNSEAFLLKSILYANKYIYTNIGPPKEPNNNGTGDNLYTFAGVKTESDNLTKTKMLNNGWVVILDEPYSYPNWHGSINGSRLDEFAHHLKNNAESLAEIGGANKAKKFIETSEWIFVGAMRKEGDGKFVVGAMGHRNKVIKKTTSNNTTVDNGVNWYNRVGASFGFVTKGQRVSLNSADTGNSYSNTRLSWHTYSRNKGASGPGGYRAGTRKGLNSNRTWRKIIMMPKPGFSSAKKSDFWSIIKGSEHCEITNKGDCVSDGKGNHENRENCEIKALKNMNVYTPEFNTERGYDWLTINNKRYMGTNGIPKMSPVKIKKNDIVKWRSDYSVLRPGFTLCGSENIIIGLTSKKKAAKFIINNNDIMINNTIPNLNNTSIVEKLKKIVTNGIMQNNKKRIDYYNQFIKYIKLNNEFLDHTFRKNKIDIQSLNNKKKEINKINSYNTHKNPHKKKIQTDLGKRLTIVTNEENKNKIILDDLQNNRQMNVRESLLSMKKNDTLSRLRYYIKIITIVLSISVTLYYIYISNKNKAFKKIPVIILLILLLLTILVILFI